MIIFIVKILNQNREEKENSASRTTHRTEKLAIKENVAIKENPGYINTQTCLR